MLIQTRLALGLDAFSGYKVFQLTTLIESASILDAPVEDIEELLSLVTGGSAPAAYVVLEDLMHLMR